jgi:F0F1-type ATP synthase delta subunit
MAGDAMNDTLPSSPQPASARNSATSSDTSGSGDWWALFLVLLGLQCLFWYHSRHHLPELGVVPEPISYPAALAMSFGDEEFYFRAQALRLQNTGDTFGRVTPLKDYDLEKIKEWFLLLDKFNHRSNLLPNMAAYYFSQTQDKEQTRYMAEYLYSHAMQNPSTKWWWLAQAVYLANHRLKDRPWALEMAKELAAVEGEMPWWARQMPAFILEEMGDREAAMKIIESILDNYKDIPPNELRFMKYFIEERLKEIAPDALQSLE